MAQLHVHTGLNDLQRYQPLDRFGLLGHVDCAHASLSDLLDQLVRADNGARPFRRFHRRALICQSRREGPGESPITFRSTLKPEKRNGSASRDFSNWATGAREPRVVLGSPYMYNRILGSSLARMIPQEEFQKKRSPRVGCGGACSRGAFEMPRLVHFDRTPASRCVHFSAVSRGTLAFDVKVDAFGRGDVEGSRECAARGISQEQVRAGGLPVMRANRSPWGFRNEPGPPSSLASPPRRKRGADAPFPSAI